MMQSVINDSISAREIPHRARRWAVPLLGGLSSLALHAVLIGPALLGLVANSDHLSRPVSEAPTMMLVLTEPDALHSKDANEMAYMATLSPSLETIRPKVTSEVMAALDLPIGDGEDNSKDDKAQSNDAEVSDLLQRYMSQIDVRIQRAWARPRSSVSENRLACLIKVSQEDNGHVQEIEIAQCNEDLPWQMSLVRAIQSATPLPAPPDPQVFSHSLSIEFVAQPVTMADAVQDIELQVHAHPR